MRDNLIVSENSLHNFFELSAQIKENLIRDGSLASFNSFLKLLSEIQPSKLSFRIISDNYSQWAARHLNEELIIRYKAGSALGRPDRDAISSRFYEHYSSDSLVALLKNEAFSSETDMLVCFAAQKNSGLEKVINAAKEKGIKTFVLASETATDLLQAAEYSLSVPSQDQFLLYHFHELFLHLLCERLEPDFSESNFGSEVVLKNSIELDKKFSSDSAFYVNFSKVKEVLENCIKKQKSIYLAGNGGSTCDSNSLIQHLKAQFNKDRYFEIFDLHCPGALLAAFNDGYAPFARQVEACAKAGDVFIVYSTSGNSQNLIEAVKIAKTKAVITVGLLGKGGGELAKLCDYSIIVPADETARIQESHALIGAALFDDYFI
jgi:D-sedoheptulose 7-phosphate isomerase